jgi:hypothetical protein
MVHRYSLCLDSRSQRGCYERLIADPKPGSDPGGWSAVCFWGWSMLARTRGEGEPGAADTPSLAITSNSEETTLSNRWALHEASLTLRGGGRMRSERRLVHEPGV